MFAILLAACGEAGVILLGDAEAGAVDVEAQDAGDAESELDDGDSIGEADGRVFPSSFLCGNGRLDPIEECDDFNRMNGDGCDWRCLLGDGEDPPRSAAGSGSGAPRPRSDGDRARGSGCD